MPRFVYGLLIVALWVAWCVYWMIAARNAKATRRIESIGSRLTYCIPLLISSFLLADHRIMSGWITAVYLPPDLRLPAYWFGFACVVAGLGFTVWARIHLGSNWSGSVTQKENHELIQNGPYALVRHPIYTGIILAVLGTALAGAAWRGLIALVLTTAALKYKSTIEERWMTELFPDAYPAYRAKVRAIIPYIW